jgi:hypothetical protein
MGTGRKLLRLYVEQVPAALRPGVKHVRVELIPPAGAKSGSNKVPATTKPVSA